MNQRLKKEVGDAILLCCQSRSLCFEKKSFHEIPISRILEMLVQCDVGKVHVHPDLAHIAIPHSNSMSENLHGCFSLGKMPSA